MMLVKKSKTHGVCMATITELEQDLADYKEARRRVLLSQSYTVGQRTLSRANLEEIERAIRRLEHRLAIAKNDGKAPGSSVVFGGHLG